MSFEIAAEGPVAVVTMTDGENRIGSAQINAWNEALDTVAGDEAISAMVVTGHSHYWSTGLDLDEVNGLDSGAQRSFMRQVDLLLGRLLTAPFVTVAALNGHTYAAGGLLALAHDYRIMREDRGFFCLPSVDIGIPFTPGMSALIAAKLPQPIAHDLVISCRRIGGREAAAAGVVHRAADEEAVLPIAKEFAHAFSGKNPDTLATVKRRMYPDLTAMLTADA